MITTDPVRLASAGALTAVYVLWCVLTFWRHRRRARLAARLTEVDGTTESDASTIDDASVLVAYASQTGTATELATGAVALLRTAGVSARLVEIAHLSSAVLARTRRLLLVASTTGEGDAPDHAEPFVRSVMAMPGSLGHLEYGVLALGDRSYQEYCAFGRAVDRWLRESAARPLFDRIEVDGQDEDALETWANRLRGLCGGVDVALQGPCWVDAPVVERRCLNDGSPGGPVYLVSVDAMGLSWRAGDIAIVQVPTPTDTDPRCVVQREYSIASTSEHGRLDLVVRQVCLGDGRLGVGSGWLTTRVGIGDTVRLRVRENVGFRGEVRAPAILIGNGTGIAGLRAHLLERASARDAGQTWLLFGERTVAHDFHFRDELERHAQTGALSRLDVAFSRDRGDGRYVQALVRASGPDVRRWIDDGAVIYVCGSREGMAPAVHTALTEALGADVLTMLAAAGRYRRDVY